ncbi:CaiB/BaiF CoA transferase family protein [Chloroflexota bacterium]
MGMLSGVKIAEFGGVVAGAYATKYLSLMGAQVIKIESMNKLDLSRVTPAGVYRMVSLSPTDTVISNENNINKMDVTLDLREPEAQELAMRIILMSDIVVENFRPGIMERFGLSYSKVKELKPNVIYLSMSMAGNTGPEANYTGYAPIFSALGGMGHLTGYYDGPATEIRFPTDIMAGTTAAFSLLAAIIHHKKTGEGQYIDFSDREASTAIIGESIMDYTMNDRNLSREGNRDDVMAPHNCYRCQGDDKWVSIAIATDEEWQAFCDAIGNPDWTRELRFSDGFDRWQNQEELDRLIQVFTLEHTHYEVMDILQKAGVAAMPSFNAEELCGDPHLGDRELMVVVDHQTLGAQTVFSPPWKASQNPPEILTAGPPVGQHNEYVFRKLLQLSEEEYSRLVEKKIIY